VIDIITVVFRPELYYIKIQARSIEEYIDPTRINKIYVVVNDDENVCDLIEPEWYGVNSNKLEIVHRDRFGVDEKINGWSSQQYYKLAMAAECAASWSMCLDAKTWFIQKLDWSKLFDDRNRVKMNSFPTIPVFKPAEQFLEKYFNIESKQVVGPGGVPFFFSTPEMKLLNKRFQRRDSSLFDFFRKNCLMPTFLTEFMLYSAWIKYLHGSHDKLYNHDQYYQVRNIADFQRHDFDELFKEMINPQCLTASIHLSVYPHLTKKQLDTWVDFLYNKNLISNKQETLEMLNTGNVE
jgi:hypothetical protein